MPKYTNRGYYNDPQNRPDAPEPGEEPDDYEPDYEAIHAARQEKYRPRWADD